MLVYYNFRSKKENYRFTALPNTLHSLLLPASATFKNHKAIYLIPLSELLGSLGILSRGRSIAGARERLLFVPSRSGLAFMLPFPSASFPQSRMFGKLEAFLLSL